MNKKIEISIEYENESISEAVSSSVKPDNFDTPEGVNVETKSEGEVMKTVIEVDGEIETLVNTTEDLLSCVATAERMI